ELGLPTDTWAVIFDPKYLEKVKGRITVLDSSSELFAAALKYLGYSANDTDPKHWDEATALIKKAKPYWAAFNASSYIKELTVGNIWLVHGYSNDIFQANQDAQQYIKPEIQKLPAVFPPKELQGKLEQLKDLTVAQRRLRNKQWTEIKASR